MRVVGLIVILAGCSFDIHATAVDASREGTGPGDGVVDTLIDVPDGMSTFGDIDLIPALEEYASDGDWTVTNVTLDTTTLTSNVLLPAEVTFTAGVQNNGAAVAILRVKDFRVTGTLLVLGTRPLVIIAGHDATIAGTIDVGARLAVAGAGGHGPAQGPGAGGTGGATAAGNEDGAGGGGGFGTAGAPGGAGGTPTNPVSAGGTGGPSYAATTLAGGSGGGGLLGAGCTNKPGGGGGAILIYGKHKIDVMGGITVGGGGGAAGINCGAQVGAGAGGGAGGMIYLQTADLKGNGILAANGGAGGGGECASSSNEPTAGGDGALTTTTPAIGGIGGIACGAAGGNGAVGATAATTTPALFNGGGGGGGHGRIIFRAPDTAMITSSPTAVAAN